MKKWLSFGMAVITICLILSSCSSKNMHIEFEGDSFAFEVSPETILALGKANKEAFKKIRYFSGSGTITDIRTTQWVSFPGDQEEALYTEHLEIILDNVIRLDIPLGPSNTEHTFHIGKFQEGDIVAFEGAIVGLIGDEIWVITQEENVAIQ